jgi:hypothetical protein
MSQPARAAVANVSESDASPQPGNKPVDKIRIGAVTASIWNNPSEKGDFYSVTFERSYKGEGDAWKSSQSFRRDDLLELAKAADKAHDRILELRQTSRA